MTNEPTNAQFLAMIAGLALAARTAINRTDLGKTDDVATTLEMIHEALAQIGGSAVMLADQLNCADEFHRRVDEGQDRLRRASLSASAGLGGSA